MLLAQAAVELRRAGLHRITVSLDTLRGDRFERLTRVDRLADVLAGIDAVKRAGFPGLKLDAVITRGDNDDELVELVDFARSVDAEIRFIEYMDVGGATRWDAAKVVSRVEILDRLAAAFGDATPLPQEGPAPASRYRLPSGQFVGIIASTTTPFCSKCDRIRLTADGHLFFCLYSTSGLDIRTPLRAGASDEELAAMIATAWQARTDRGAEARLAAPDRSVFIAVDELRRAPQLEMHTRGG